MTVPYDSMQDQSGPRSGRESRRSFTPPLRPRPRDTFKRVPLVAEVENPRDWRFLKLSTADRGHQARFVSFADSHARTASICRGYQSLRRCAMIVVARSGIVRWILLPAGFRRARVCFTRSASLFGVGHSAFAVGASRQSLCSGCLSVDGGTRERDAARRRHSSWVAGVARGRSRIRVTTRDGKHHLTGLT